MSERELDGWGRVSQGMGQHQLRGEGNMVLEEYKKDQCGET